MQRCVTQKTPPPPPCQTLPLECSSKINSLGKRLARVYARHPYFLGTLAKIKQNESSDFSFSYYGYSISHCRQKLTVHLQKDAARRVCPEYAAISTMTLLYYSDDNLRVCKTTALFTDNITIISRQLLHKATQLGPSSNSSMLGNTLRFRYFNWNLFKKTRHSRRRHCTGYVRNKL